MRNKHLISALAAALVTAVGARAADLPTIKSAPFVASTPASLWSGLYGGVEGGYAWAEQPNVPLTAYSTGFSSSTGLASDYVPFASGSKANAVLNSNGFVGGAAIGWNFQSGNWVYGVEANWDALVGSRKTANFALSGLGTAANVAEYGAAWRWAALVGPRAGWLLTPSFLVYARGGLALAQLDTSISSGTFAAVSSGYGASGKTLAGWFIGAGGEWMITPGLSTKIEYRYIDFGAHTASLTGIAYGGRAPFFGQQATTFIASGHPREHAVVVGLNIHFGQLFSSPFVTPTGNPIADLRAFNQNVMSGVSAVPARIREKTANSSNLSGK
jgi:outer membrane immunogenic protein